MEEPSPHSRQRLRAAIAVAVFVVVLDQITKRWALNNLVSGSCAPEGSCIDVFWTLRFHLTFNPGASFSSGESLGAVFGVIAAVMTVVLLRFAMNAESQWHAAVFGLVAGGAVGNLIDRVVRAESGLLSGEVVDFIDFQWWPIFNIADMAIVGGVVALITIGLFFSAEEALDREPAPEESIDETSRQESSP